MRDEGQKPQYVIHHLPDRIRDFRTRTLIAGTAQCDTHPCPPRQPARSPCTFSSHLESLRGGSAAVAFVSAAPLELGDSVRLGGRCLPVPPDARESGRDVCVDSGRETDVPSSESGPRASGR